MATIINGKGTVGVKGGAVVGAPIITQFITTWKTDNAGTSTSTQIRIPTSGSGYACTVDWGDGTSDTYSGTAPTMLHTYPSVGTYTVKISGTFPRIYFNNGGDRLKLLTIENWGNIAWPGSMDGAFSGCANLKINASDVPNFASVTSANSMFTSCSSLTSLNVSGWNFGSCTDMTQMFYNTTSLSAITGINTWNTSKVTSVSTMFMNSVVRTIDLSGLNLSACTSFGSMFRRATLIRNINVSNMILNTSANIDMSHMFMHDAGGSSLTGVTGMNTWNTSKVNNTSQMFSNCTVLPSLDLSGWNMTANTNTTSMFQSCSVLTGITGLNTWNTSKVINTSSMFNGCTSLSSLNLSNWNLSSCTNFGTTTTSGMFYSCTNLKDINVSNWLLNTTSNISMQAVFRLCSSLSAVTGLNTWNTSKVTDTSYMFNVCSSLLSLDLSNWNINTTSNTNMFGMFSSCTALTGITGLNTWNTSKVINTGSIFSSCSSLSSLDLSNWNMSANTNTSSMFNGCTSLSSLNIPNWNLSACTITISMFNGCTSLSSLDLSNWNLSSCTNFGNTTTTGMFYSCTNLKDINVNNWLLNTTSNIAMYGVFRNCTSLTGITGLNTWNTSKVTDTSLMFNICSSLSSLDLSNWNMSANTSTSNMFTNCSNLKDINVSNWILNTTSNIIMTGMFGTCTALSGITGINNWNTSKVTNTNSMFVTCNSLSSLDLSNWNLSACTNFTSMFNGCTSLTGLSVSNWTLSTSLASNIIMSSMFTNMGTVTPKTITGLNTWNITRVTNFSNFLATTTLDTTTYSNMLIAWDALDPVNSLTFNGGSSKYNAAGQTARQSLITNDLWSITDGGLQP